MTHPKPSLHRPDSVQVTYRRMKFDFEDGFPRYWLQGSPFKSLFWTQLSTAFQPGEKFFIDSARAFKDRLDDPELLEELMNFCRQEGHHTAQHMKFDRVNGAMGIDVAASRARFAAILDRARQNLTPMQMLAGTCALEHFTSGFADMYFACPDLSEGADPRVAALWAWHAAEEVEHRATCFDIYQQLSGNYVMRVASLVTSWSLILMASIANTLMLLRKDGKLFTLDTLKGVAYLFGPRGIVTRLLPAFLRYFHPKFHPWKTTGGHHADAATIARWQAENERYIQNLDDVHEQRGESGGDSAAAAGALA